MLVEAIGLREIPDGAARLIRSGTPQDGRASVLVAEFIGPLRDVAFEVEDAEWARGSCIRVHICERGHHAAVIGRWYGLRIPIISPRVGAPVGGLRGVLPFPIVREALAGPCGVGARVFDGDPGYRFRTPTSGIGSVLPIAQKIVVVGWMVFRRVQKFLELLVGDGRAVNIEARDVHALAMKTPRRIFPGILHIHAWIIAALDFNSLYREIEIRFGDLQHAWRSCRWHVR